MRLLSKYKRLSYNSKIFINVILFIITAFLGNAESEITIGVKAQPITINSMVDNFALCINAGPFLKKNEIRKLYVQFSSESFYKPAGERTYRNSDYWFMALDGVLQKSKGEKFSIGPLISLKMFDEYDILYNDYKDGSWEGILLGAGVQCNLNLKKGNVFSGRTCFSAPVVKWCYFNRDEDSAAWVDTIGFEDEYHYSDRYLQNLKDNAKAYDRYKFLLYWTFSYTKYAEWIFVGVGINGFWNFSYHKVDKFDFDHEMSTFFHFGVKIKRKEN